MSPPRHQFVSTASQGSMDEDGEVELAMGDIYRDRLTKTERRRRRRQKLMSALSSLCVPLLLTAALIVALSLAMELRSSAIKDVRVGAWFTVRAPMTGVAPLAIEMWTNLLTASMDVPGLQASVSAPLSSVVSSATYAEAVAVRKALDYAVHIGVMVLVLGCMSRALSVRYRDHESLPWFHRAIRVGLGLVALGNGVYLVVVGLVRYPEALGHDLGTNPQQHSVLALISATSVVVDQLGNKAVASPDSTTVITGTFMFRRYVALCIFWMCFGVGLLLAAVSAGAPSREGDDDVGLVLGLRVVAKDKVAEEEEERDHGHGLRTDKAGNATPSFNNPLRRVDPPGSLAPTPVGSSLGRGSPFTARSPAAMAAQAQAQAR